MPKKQQESKTAKMRLFVAVNIPDELKEKIACLKEKLRLSGADVKWVKKENFHITLKFLGEVAEEKIEGICLALKKTAQGDGPFEILFKGLGAFPDKKRPRVVWLGIENGKERLANIFKNIDVELESMGFKKETREFASHITLGRARSGKNIISLVNKIESLEASVIGVFKAEKVDLMSSVLYSSGPVYECLKSITI
jgi:RNA 2',3'-cyclic 3'-phosphodiesterase